MAKQRKFLVLDTETATLECANSVARNADEKKRIAIAKPLVYDLGYVVVNASGKILKRVNYLIKEIYNDNSLFQTAYYAHKRPIYECKLRTGEITLVNWMSALKELENDLQDVEITAAFNACFDFKKAIEFTCKYIYYRFYKNQEVFNEWYYQQYLQCMRIAEGDFSEAKRSDYMSPYFTLFKRQYPITDLWTLACEYLANNKRYKYFCLNNDRLTNSVEYFSSTAESVFAYFIKDADYEEEHTALADAEIEAQILVKLIKAKAFAQTIEAFPFRKMGSTFDFIENSPKYKEPTLEKLRQYIDNNDGWNKGGGYWIRICKIYDLL